MGPGLSFTSVIVSDIALFVKESTFCDGELGSCKFDYS